MTTAKAGWPAIGATLVTLTLMGCGGSSNGTAPPPSPIVDAASKDATTESSGMVDGSAVDVAQEARLDGQGADASPGSCVLANGVPCNRWVRTEPNGQYTCFGY